MGTPRRPRRKRSKVSTRCARCLANPHDRPFVTMWNTTTGRKIAGTAAPCPDEVNDYLARHPHVQVYRDQDGGPAAIHQRRKDRNREKERKKRERKRSHQDRDSGAGIGRGDVDCCDDGSTATGQMGQTRNERLDHLMDVVHGETQRQSIMTEPLQVLKTPTMETEKQNEVQREARGEKENCKEEDIGGVYPPAYPEDIFQIGPQPAGEEPLAIFAQLMDQNGNKTPVRNGEDPDTEDEQEQQLAAEFPEFAKQDRGRQMAPKPSSMTQRAVNQRNPCLWKLRVPVLAMQQRSDVVLAQRVWTAEAYAAIAERKRKRKREATMEEEDEEIREFRDLFRRAY